MTNPSQDRTPGTVPLFTYTVDKTTKSLALDQEPEWRYPCGLCNAGTVTEPGTLCADCSPAAEPPKKPRKRTSKKTTAKKTAKAPSKRVPPWERVVDRPDDSGAPRRGKRGES